MPISVDCFIMALSTCNQWLCCNAEAATPQLAASGVAAAWRLGRWEALDSYLTQARAPAADTLDGEQRWDVRIGQVLANMHRRCVPALNKG